jgi:hypothetical protein
MSGVINHAVVLMPLLCSRRRLGVLAMYTSMVVQTLTDADVLSSSPGGAAGGDGLYARG